jgi:hypothetical protein
VEKPIILDDTMIPPENLEEVLPKAPFKK